MYSVPFEMSVLKENDITVLDYIFNPNIVFDVDINEDETLNTEDEDVTPEMLKAREIELEGIKAAEEERYEEAIQIFTTSIATHENASGYNNRAQAYRLLGDDSGALEDLDNSIKLCKRKSKVLCQALCQRALLYRKSGDDEKAKEDFKLAAELGSQFAKKQLVEMNPYAAMCNQMLNHMMSKLNNIENNP
ncbi:tetratricopeptide repeat protein 36 [Halyomorpha halys]|uniref:tetratricopeptide repeat protein 36 n=1 Tax=Halyomorpha halys TaxID=286706 RepID=UPI0006D51647|nr:tetratricopeptide repeat protein 36 [Halyomorpha halys]